MRFQGRVTTWHDDKGFGYITRDGGGAPLFVHIKGFRHGQRRPLGGELVTYEEGKDDRGRRRASNVCFLSLPKHTQKSTGAGLPSLVLAGGFLAAIAFAALIKAIPWLMAAGYAAASAITYIAYAIDRSAAQNNRRRTPESTLQTLALIGGWPGAAIAQVRLRHKSQKLSFRVMFWMMAIIHCTAVSWLFFSSSGRTWLKNTLAAVWI